MKKIIVILLVFLFTGVIFFVAKKPNAEIQNRNYIATVNGDPIYRSDFEEKLNQKRRFYQWAKNDQIDMNVVAQDLKNELVDFMLVRQYAEKNKITVSQQEIAGLYQDSVKNYNSEEELLTKIDQMYGMDKTDYQENLAAELLKEKVQKNIAKSLTVWLADEKQKSEILWK